MGRGWWSSGGECGGDVTSLTPLMKLKAERRVRVLQKKLKQKQKENGVVSRRRRDMEMSKTPFEAKEDWNLSSLSP